MKTQTQRVVLVFADRGSFHDLMIELPAQMLHNYPRLIDALREDPAVSAAVYIDFKRLVAAHLVPDVSPDELS